MTPTQAQIDAALKAFCAEGYLTATDHAGYVRPRLIAALTAAAEVMPKNKQRQFKMGYEHVVAATIERCAQVADHFEEINVGDTGDLELLSSEIAAAIRALATEGK